MAKLEYSLSALNILNKFYQAKVLVFVEGDDDLPFWRAVFTALSDCEVAVESLGGSEELDKYIDRIVKEGAELVVARDADYLPVTGRLVSHDRVVYTYGYSIENSLYVPNIIRKVTHLIDRRDAPEECDVVAWLDDFVEALKPLVIGDIASQLGGLGVAVLGNNCGRYMRSAKSCVISREKVGLRATALVDKVPRAAAGRAEGVVRTRGGYDVRLVRGHVLASAIVRFVNEHSRRNVSAETVFTSSIVIFQGQIAVGHPHGDFYREAVSRALESKRRHQP